VVFTGYLSNEELAKITAAAFSLCYVSLFEGFGIPIVEAMKCAVPVICSNTSSMKEIAEGAALLVNPLSTEDISEAMAKLYDDPNLYSEMSKKGFEHQKKFSWENTANLLWKSCLKAIHQ
jgi:glycosyltransferase involved in cell wall biosynthesis